MSSQKTPPLLRIAIADDEPLARARLKRLLEAIPQIEIVGEATNGLEALSLVATTQPDILLLDIEMPVLNGLEVATVLSHQKITIIFVTAYSEHTLKAFEVSAFDYLVKPIDPTRLAQSLEKWRLRQERLPVAADSIKLSHELQQTIPAPYKTRLAIRCGARYLIIDSTEISAILACDHYVNILTGDKELLSEETLDHLAERLDPQRFMRVHRGAIINLSFLKELLREGDRKYIAILGDTRQTRVPISRKRLGMLKGFLGLGSW